MTEQRYAVPEEGLKATVDAVNAALRPPEKMEVRYRGLSLADIFRIGLERGFIRWQDGELVKKIVAINKQTFGSDSEASVNNFCANRNGHTQAIQDVRRMYMVQEPEWKREGPPLSEDGMRRTLLHEGVDADVVEKVISDLFFMEPSVLEEGIKGLLWQGKKLYDHQPHELNAAHDEDVKESFQRGQESK